MKLADSVLEELWFAEDNGETAALEASQSLAAKLGQVEGLKTFPAVAQKIMIILGKTDFRVVEVTRALEEDPALAASVLRMANSAFFAGSKSVSSINQAFVRLGARTVKEVVCAVATMGMFMDSSGIGLEIRDHCASTAAIVQHLAREFAPKLAEGIFLCGLMHDIGKMLLIESGEMIYTKDTVLSPNTMHMQERDVLGYDHAVLGGHTMTLWNLEGPISKVIAWHHQPARAFSDQIVGTMVALLRLADQIDFQLKQKTENYEKWIDELSKTQDCEFPGVSGDWLKNNWKDLYTVRNHSLELFSGG